MQADEGLYVLSTADIGKQMYMIAHQDDDARFAPGRTIVWKVEPVRSWHEEQLYRDAGWIVKEDLATGESFALRSFAFVDGEAIKVFRRFRNQEVRVLVGQTLALASLDDNPEWHEKNLEWLGVRPSGGEAAAIPGARMLWENHAAVLESFCRNMADAPSGRVKEIPAQMLSE